VQQREISSGSRQQEEQGVRVQQREELLRVEERSRRLHRCHVHHHNKTLQQLWQRRCQLEWQQRSQRRQRRCWRRSSKDKSRDSCRSHQREEPQRPEYNHHHPQGSERRFRQCWRRLSNTSGDNNKGKPATEKSGRECALSSARMDDAHEGTAVHSSTDHKPR